MQSLSIMRSYTYDAEKLKCWIEREKIKKFAVQLPAGLLPRAREILEELGGYGEPLLYAEPAFGACDFPDLDAIPEIDGLVQLGHAEIPGVTKNRKILFLELYSTAEPKPPDKIPGNMGDRICLLTTVQYLKQLQKIADFLKEAGRRVHIPGPMNRTLYPGQVLGCDVSSAAACSTIVDSYLFVGDGRFHPAGIAMLTSRPVYRYLPSGRIEPLEFEREKFLRAGVSKASAIRDARTVAIVVCTKPGQKRLKLARELAGILKSHGKNPCFLTINNLSPEFLNYTGNDLLISTACPRVALEDYGNYEVPLLTPQEALLGLGEIKNYEMDQFLPGHI
ncbi:MAG: diphthamide biosynthesis enzyme Dph2 [Thermoplasmata archaeon]|nr:diphthamide biosynthesis enzyme Dph2 [Thermoplasmata archaeon]